MELFASAPPGLEALVAEELAELGIRGAPEPGGVAWTGGSDQLQAAHLHLRCASRVLVRLGSFKARAFYELEKRARRLHWEPFLPPGVPVAFRVTSARSKLYHERAIEERLLEEMARRGVAVADAAPGGDEEAADAGGGGHAAADGSGAGGDTDTRQAAEPGAEPQLFVVRAFRDRFEISADASGAHLHRRGYRRAVARAPLRETLAAAVLRASGWRPEAPLLDPFCGSGTIPIEAALIARRIPPALACGEPRRFAFQRWEGFDAGGWERALDAARGGILPTAPAPIRGSDRDAGAVEAARSNAERAGVAGEVEFTRGALSTLEPPEGTGWLLTNPPYGGRVGESGALRDLYAALGRVARERLPGWTVALLSADRALERQMALPLEERVAFSNGGIPVRLVSARVPHD
jgi:putative N6-adenine-specific DNA methylase